MPFGHSQVGSPGGMGCLLREVSRMAGTKGHVIWKFQTVTILEPVNFVGNIRVQWATKPSVAFGSNSFCCHSDELLTKLKGKDFKVLHAVQTHRAPEFQLPVQNLDGARSFEQNKCLNPSKNSFTFTHILPSTPHFKMPEEGRPGAKIDFSSVFLFTASCLRQTQLRSFSGFFFSFFFFYIRQTDNSQKHADFPQ